MKLAVLLAAFNLPRVASFTAPRVGLRSWARRPVQHAEETDKGTDTVEVGSKEYYGGFLKSPLEVPDPRMEGSDVMIGMSLPKVVFQRVSVSWRISRIIWRTNRQKPHPFPMAHHIVFDIVSV